MGTGLMADMARTVTSLEAADVFDHAWDVATCAFADCLGSGVAGGGTQEGAISNEWVVEFLNVVPLKPWAKVEEVAAGVAFLARRDSSFATGIVCPIDGGWSARRISLSEEIL